ncbi:hypothetical protein [Kibdelosporangium philippinense]|uniref:hypothetical protein n=1 Tax=Kibdelosporangium philippinense TaxID=211113 RepID=UPI003612E1B3
MNTRAQDLKQVHMRAAFEHLNVHKGHQVTSLATHITPAPPTTGYHAAKVTFTAFNAPNSALTPE